MFKVFVDLKMILVSFAVFMLLVAIACCLSFFCQPAQAYFDPTPSLRDDPGESINTLDVDFDDSGGDNYCGSNKTLTIDPQIQAALDASYCLESSWGKNLVGKHGEIGPLQIKAKTVRDVNRICALRGYRERFTLDDRWYLEKSSSMFWIICSYYGGLYQKQTGNSPDAHFFIKLWNGGYGGWNARGTVSHHKKAIGFWKKYGYIR